MKTIHFFLASDTLVYLTKKIILNLSSKSKVKVLTPKHTNENADATILELLPNIKHNHFSISSFLLDRPDSVVFGNDWSVEAKIFIALCRFFNIPTYCIQESVVDFGDNKFRLHYADYIFIQGEQTRKHLKRDNLILTGNPRYEDFTFTPVSNIRVLINCNFTYGIHEDIRNSWIDDISKACIINEIDFAISQHPRDQGDLTKYKSKVIQSSASSISKQILTSSILITRFSSLIHEAILQGRKVIYYNPHREKILYDFTPDNNNLYFAKNYHELNSCIMAAKIELLSKKNVITYANLHFRPFDKKPSSIIEEVLLSNNTYIKNNFVINLFIISFQYSKTILRYYLKKTIRYKRKSI